MSFIRIRGDNGWDECNSCAHRESDTCEFCDEADQWEEGDQDRLARAPERELLAA